MITRKYKSEAFGYKTSFVSLVLLATMYQVLKNGLSLIALLYFHLALGTP